MANVVSRCVEAEFKGTYGCTTNGRADAQSTRTAPITFFVFVTLQQAEGEVQRRTI
jgi:hypothetical protein